MAGGNAGQDLMKLGYRAVIVTYQLRAATPVQGFDEVARIILRGCSPCCSRLTFVRLHRFRGDAPKRGVFKLSRSHGIGGSASGTRRPLREVQVRRAGR